MIIRYKVDYLKIRRKLKLIDTFTAIISVILGCLVYIDVNLILLTLLQFRVKNSDYKL